MALRFLRLLEIFIPQGGEIVKIQEKIFTSISNLKLDSKLMSNSANLQSSLSNCAKRSKIKSLKKYIFHGRKIFSMACSWIREEMKPHIGFSILTFLTMSHATEAYVLM